MALSPMSYVSGGLGIALTLSLAGNAILHANNKTLKAEKKGLVQEVEIVTGVVKTQQSTLGTINTLALAGVDQVKELNTKVDTLNAETRSLNNEINELRLTEELNANLTPYARGIAARTRLCGTFVQLSSTGSIEGCDSPRSATPDDISGTDIPARESPRTIRDDDGEGGT